MRNIILALLLLGITVYAVKTFYNNPEYIEGMFVEKEYAYPDEITIKNENGSEIQITLLGRNSNYLKFNRKDGQRFVYPINSLSEKSQTLVMKYPDSGIGDVSSYLSSGDMELKDAYIVQLEDEIRKIRAKKALLETKAEATTSQTELRTLEREISRMDYEITELENKIASRQ